MPPWTQEVSERLMDLQLHIERLIDADGVRTLAEQALIDELKATQAVITAVEREIVGVLTTVRTGQQSRQALRQRLIAGHPAPVNLRRRRTDFEAA